MKCPRCDHENTGDSRFCAGCGLELGTPAGGREATLTLQTPVFRLKRGTVLARRFEIIEEVGRGGMGAVYKAYDPQIDEVVAIKVLRPEIASEPEVIERFRNEIKLARQVAHRHVCRMYDIGEDGLMVFISMEYVAGEDLKSFIRRSGHINEAKAVDIARQVAEGLAEAHRLGVVHRDLKPQNIMIDRQGNVKIMDFGIARSLQNSRRTGTGVIIGTPDYMSPEQADSREADQRADIYALGGILFEMVTGRVPFEGDTPLSVVLKHKSEAPASPDSLNVQVSPRLSRVILKCLEKDREKRYQSAEALLRDLQEAEKEPPVPYREATSRPVLPDKGIAVKFRLRKLLVPAAVIVAAAVMIILASSGRKEPARFPQGARPEAATRFTTQEKGRAGPAGDRKAAYFDASSISGLLAPLTRPNKPLTEQEAKEVVTALVKIREKYPEFGQLLDSIQSRLAEMEKLRSSGDTTGTEKVMSKSESETRKLLAQVNEREKAERAYQELTETRKKAAAALKGKGNLLAWIAAEKEKDALDAFSKNDFSGARILYGLLARVHLLSVSAGDEENSLALLRGLAEETRLEAEKAQAPVKEAWLYNRAKEEAGRAGRLSADRQYALAAEQYILAAFLYRKSAEVALETGGTARD